MIKREPAPGESAEALLLELRATMLLAQRRQLRAQRRGFQRIAARVDYEMQETIRSDATWPEAMPGFQRKRAILETAIAQTDDALARNGQALAAPVRDPFDLISNTPAELIETARTVQQRRADRKYRRNISSGRGAGLRLVASEAA